MNSDAPINATANSSFLTSLGDDELIEFIQKISQDRRAEPTEPVENPTENRTENPTTELGDSSILPSSPVKVGRLGSITLAQKPSSSIAEGISEDEAVDLDFGDYTTYFHNKQIRQQEKDQEFLAWRQKMDSKEFPSIFANCVIHVNGRTDPDIQQLHKMIVLHGGTFLQFLGAKGNATHIIASNLTPRKKLEFRNYKVVTPNWVVDSVAQKKRLPWQDYLYIQPEYGQTRLEFGRWDSNRGESENAEIYQGSKQDDNPKEDDMPGNIQNESENLDEMLKGDHNLEESSKKDDSLTGKSPENNENQNDDVLAVDEFEEKPDEQHSLKDDSEVNIEDKSAKKEKELEIDAKHPDFLKYFFKRSRLHHLSTWKADLRAEFLKRALEKTSSSHQPASPNRTVFHVDFDCFFASVSAMAHPSINQEVDAVCVTYGSANSEISSCNYVARKFGVKNGMWMKHARTLCPNLKCLDYNFDEYEKISKIFYAILMEIENLIVFPVSIDEALIQVSRVLTAEEANALACSIREKVQTFCGCSVSVGSGPNVLLAKLALRKCKPNGQLHVCEDLEHFLDHFNVSQLPGIGSKIAERLKDELRVEKIGHLRNIAKSRLISVFGVKTGASLFDASRGIDDTCIDISLNPTEFLRKSVSVDVNWGIRFETIDQVETFLFNVSMELHKRLVKIGMIGSQLTIKMAKRAPDAPEVPEKFMGMGLTNMFTKSSRLGVATREPGILSTEAKYLYRMLNIPPKELRGIALQMTKLVDEKSEQSNQTRLPFKKLPDLEPSALSNGAEDKHKEQPLTKHQLTKNQLSRSPDEERFMSKSGIDYSIFKELPLAIQREVKAELESRNIPIQNTPATPRKSKFHVQPIFGRSPTEKVIRVLSPEKKSPLKYKNSPSKSPNKRYKVSKLPPVKMAPLQLEEDYRVDKKWIHAKKEYLHVPFLQGKSTPKDVMGLLETWVESTLDIGPHDKDVAILLRYVELLLERRDLGRAKSLKDYLQHQLYGLEGEPAFKDWQIVVERVGILIGIHWEEVMCDGVYGL